MSDFEKRRCSSPTARSLASTDDSGRRSSVERRKIRARLRETRRQCAPSMGWYAKNVYFVCAFAAIGGGLFGFDITSMSGVLLTQAYKNYFDDPASFRQGGITAAMPAGSFIGSLLSSWIADKESRKTAIRIACIFWVIGSLVQCGSVNLPMLCSGRVIAGFGVGIASAIVPVYMAEIAPKEIRGRIVSLQQWAITWGILIQYYIQYGASFVSGGPTNPEQGTAAFRIPWGVQSVPAIILFIGMQWLPHSPRWLGAMDRWDEAIQVLADLHSKGDIYHPKVLAEYQEIEAALTFEREVQQSTFRAILAPKMFKRVILGMSVQMWSQLCGMNMTMYYIGYIMEAAGVGSPLLSASILYVINVVLTLPAIMYLDRWGRRPTMLAGSLAMLSVLCICAAIQGVYGRPNTFKNKDLDDISWIVSDDPVAARVVIATTYLFVAIYAVTWGPTSWTYPAEIFPSKVRARAVSLSTGTNWLCNTGLAFSVPPLLWHINWRTYIIFAVFNACAFVHMFLAAPETKGKLLEEMDDIFNSGRPPWRSTPKESRVDRLQQDIELGVVTVNAPQPSASTDQLIVEPAPLVHPPRVDTVIGDHDEEKRPLSSITERNDSVAPVDEAHVRT